jgi:hypothetical protein
VYASWFPEVPPPSPPPPPPVRIRRLHSAYALVRALQPRRCQAGQTPRTALAARATHRRCWPCLCSLTRPCTHFQHIKQYAVQPGLLGGGTGGRASCVYARLVRRVARFRGGVGCGGYAVQLELRLQLLLLPDVTVVPAHRGCDFQVEPGRRHFGDDAAVPAA